jgi:carboxypeptidase Ss1
MRNLEDEVRLVEPKVLEIRRKIHSNPELSYKETETSKLVARELRALGIEVKTGVGGTGVVGLIKSGKRGKVVALRADMDALPIQENVNLEFVSKNAGVMHACGHDTHVAMLIGAATILAKQRDELEGDVKLIFQPAEEQLGRGGAKPMIEDGVMENPKVDYVFGLHIMSGLPSGYFGLRPGPFMAKSDSFKIRIIGKGGHAATPHVTVDPVYIAAHVTIALQGVSSRMVDPVRPFVISVCKIHGGTKDNIIPEEVFLEGTMRTFEKGTRAKAISDIKRVASSVCAAYGGSCTVEFMKDTYPVVYNDEKATQRVIKTLKKVRGMKTAIIDQKLGVEDFSRFQEKAPGVFYFLGTENRSKGCVHPNHSSKFKVDEDVLKYGVASLVMVAQEFGS